MLVWSVRPMVTSSRKWTTQCKRTALRVDPFYVVGSLFFYRFPVAVLVVRGGKYHHAKVRR